MYNEFYKLTAKPFTIVPNPGLLYPSRKHRMALTYLEYGLLEGTGIIVLTGEIGTGKTTLIRHLLGKIDDTLESAVLFNTNVDPEDLLRLVLQEFETEPGGKDKSTNLDRLNDFLIRKYSEGRKCLLIIDEAQNLSPESLEEVRMLSNLQTETSPLIQVTLVGQPELRDKLRHPGLSQLRQRVTVTYHLGVMTRHESGEYIVHRLNMAGAENPFLFTEEAVDLIHEYSNGVPRTINILCDACLVYGFADEVETISHEIVEQVISDREAQNGDTSWDTSSADAAVDTETPALMEKRISALEAKLGKLQAMIEMHEAEIRERMESGRDRLVLEMEKLLTRERERSERLAEECSRYRMEIEQCGEQRESKPPDAENVESPVAGNGPAGPGSENSSRDSKPDKKQSKFKKLGLPLGKRRKQ